MQLPYNPYLQAYMQALQQQFQPAQAAPQMSPPTIHVDIVQVGSLEEIDRYPAGMYMLRDDSAIVVKTPNANGFALDIYDKRPPAPPAPVFDPQAYVTREELARLLNGGKEGQA